MLSFMTYHSKLSTSTTTGNGQFLRCKEIKDGMSLPVNGGWQYSRGQGVDKE